MKTIYLYHLTQEGVIRYVGVTTNIPRRKSEHKQDKPPHEFEIIDTFADKEEAGIAEQYHIAGYKTHDEKIGWNKSKGGETLLTGKNHPRYIDGRTYDIKAYRHTPAQKAYRKEYSQRPSQRVYQKEYREKNKDRIKEYKTTYMKEYEKRPERILRRKAIRKVWYQRSKRKIDIEYFINQGLVL